MDVAQRTAELSRARRLKVGAVVVKNNNIISFSWNGTPPGDDNTCENLVWMHDEVYDPLIGEATIKEIWPYLGEYLDEEGFTHHGRYRLITKSEVIHAERNSIDKLARSVESGIGAEMFVTHAPCIECSKSIYGAGITKIYYRDIYRNDLGLEFLRKHGVEIEHVKNS